MRPTALATVPDCGTCDVVSPLFRASWWCWKIGWGRWLGTFLRHGVQCCNLLFECDGLWLRRVFTFEETASHLYSRYSHWPPKIFLPHSLGAQRWGHPSVGWWHSIKFTLQVVHSKDKAVTVASWISSPSLWLQTWNDECRFRWTSRQYCSIGAKSSFPRAEGVPRVLSVHW